MKKFLELGAVAFTVLSLYSCGAKQETAKTPTAEPVSWSDTVRYENGKREYNYLEIRGYNAEGNLAVIDGYSVNDGVETYAQQSIYQGGKLVYVKGVNETGTQILEETYTYREDGQIAESLVKSWDDSRGKLMDESKVVYTYDEQGNVVNIKESVCQNLHWYAAYEWVYTYQNGVVTDRKDYTYTLAAKQERKQSRWELYAYDDKGRLKTYDFYVFDVKQGRQKHDSKTTYEYNTQGRLQKASVERHKNTRKREPILSRVYNYDYNAQGQLTYFDRQKWTPKTKSFVGEFSTNKAYDEKGRLVSSFSLSITRPKTESQALTYSYPAEAKATSVCEAAKVAFFVPVKDGKPVVDVTEANKSLTELEDEK